MIYKTANVCAVISAEKPEIVALFYVRVSLQKNQYITIYLIRAFNLWEMICKTPNAMYKK